MEKFEESDIQQYIEPARKIVEKTSRGKRRETIKEKVLLQLPSDERQIFDIQISKQHVMKTLKQDLRAIEKESNFPYSSARKRVFLDPENNQLYITTEDGPKATTFEILLEDSSKGIYYSLDASVPRSLRKRYVIEKAKQKILESYKRQEKHIEIIQQAKEQAQQMKEDQLAKRAQQKEELPEELRKEIERIDTLVEEETKIQEEKRERIPPTLLAYREFSKLLLETPEEEYEAKKKALWEMLPGGEKEKMRVFERQVQKQGFMTALHEELAAIDRNEDARHHPEARPLEWDTAEGVFKFRDEEGRIFNLTMGTLLVDLAWGNLWHLPLDAPRPLRKRYAIEKAKAAIGELYDRQLVGARLGAKRKEASPSPYKKVRYNYGYEFEKGGTGKIFERMMVDLLTELSADFPEFGIEVTDATALEDRDWKIDFFIKVKKRERAISVEGQKEGESIPSKTAVIFGIQFTITPKERGYVERKEQQIEKIRRKILQGEMPLHKVDDILIISIPATPEEITQKYKTWKSMDQPPGGPTALWDINTRIEFLKTLTQGMGIDDLIEEKQDRLVGYYNNRIVETPTE